jgi:hypothetical protein
MKGNQMPRAPKQIALSPEDYQIIYLALVDAWNASIAFETAGHGVKPALARASRARRAPYGAMIKRLFPDD